MVMDGGMLNMAVQSPSEPGTVLLVDDHPLFRVGMRTVLLRESGVVTVLEAASLEEALAHAMQGSIDVALVDVRLPVIDGVSVTAQLHALQPAMKILGLSVIDEPIRISAMLNAGASGYVLKMQPVPEMLSAIRAVLAGERYLPPSVSIEVIDEQAVDSPLAGLTSREREVLDHLIRGRTNDQIATVLFISRRTVESHRQKLLKKLGVHTVVALVHVALRAGLLED
jgi:DNA-binding NarL/FixJ family response regulator